jgi:hypothetical protein
MKKYIKTNIKFFYLIPLPITFLYAEENKNLTIYHKDFDYMFMINCKYSINELKKRIKEFL